MKFAKTLYYMYMPVRSNERRIHRVPIKDVEMVPATLGGKLVCGQSQRGFRRVWFYQPHALAVGGVVPGSVCDYPISCCISTKYKFHHLHFCEKQVARCRALTNVRALKSLRSMNEIWTRIFALPKFGWFANFIYNANNS